MSGGNDNHIHNLPPNFLDNVHVNVFDNAHFNVFNHINIHINVFDHIHNNHFDNIDHNNYDDNYDYVDNHYTTAVIDRKRVMLTYAGAIGSRVISVEEPGSLTVFLRLQDTPIRWR